ncbi:hypothetical protein ACSBR2_024678 [Camellia fascicularis]
MELKDADDHTITTSSSSSSCSSSSADQQMTTTSHHHFGNPSENSEAFSITIIESMKEEYGLFVWPCSVVLAEYVWQQRSRFSGVSVIELGAGTSLPGLVAAKVGSDVTLTDDSNRPEVLANMKRVSDLNNLNCKVMGLTWGMWDATIFSIHQKVILGADVLYDTSGRIILLSYCFFLLLLH